MADFGAVAAVGRSLERFFARAFEDLQPIPGPANRTHVVLIRTDDLDLKLQQQPAIQFPALSLLLYRVDFDKVTRAQWPARANDSGRSHLPLYLHYLLTAWADNAEHEHLILGRTMQALDSAGGLSGPQLDPLGGWVANESVQLVLEDLTTDELMRTFEALSARYRLTIPCIARSVVVTGPRTDVPPGLSAEVRG